MRGLRLRAAPSASTGRSRARDARRACSTARALGDRQAETARPDARRPASHCASTAACRRAPAPIPRCRRRRRRADEVRRRGRAHDAAAWKIRRASSRPEITSTVRPVSRLMRRMNSVRLRASRTALVATARRRTTRRTRSSRLKFISARTARSIDSVVRRPVVNERRPSRTISLTRSTTSRWPSRLTSATIICTELDPTSMAPSRIVRR